MQADLVDTNAEFEKLYALSEYLAGLPKGTVYPSPYWSGEIIFEGTNPDYNVFELDSSLVNSNNYAFNFKVPQDSYVVINITGENPILYTQSYGVTIGGTRISGNQDPLSSKILFNLPYARSF